jgi:hypothetical protein
MDPSRETGHLTRCFPSAYPTEMHALAWVMCVPGTGHGWYHYQGTDEIYSESYTQFKVDPVAWEMYADGDNTIRRYIECITHQTPLAQVPDTATKAWVAECLKLIEYARKISVRDDVLAMLEKIDTDLKERFPNVTKPEVKKEDPFSEPETREKLRALFKPAPDEERKGPSKWEIESVHHILNDNDCEATFRTPKIEEAIAAIEAANCDWLFEQLDRKRTSLGYRVVVRHRNDPHHHAEGDTVSRLFGEAREGRDEANARQILTDEQFEQWKRNYAWQQKTRRFHLAGGERTYGTDPEYLFYNQMLTAFSGPWTWPLIDATIDIFGAPEIDGTKMTFIPLEAPYHYNLTVEGVRNPKKVFPYTYDSWQSGDLPTYKPARYYKMEDLVKGVVVPIGSKRYRVSYPLVQVWLDNPHRTEYGEYPNATAPVYIEETTDPVTPYKRTGEEGYDCQFFGKPSWQQSQRYPQYKGKIGYNLFTLHDGWGDGGSTNLMFCMDENGVPVRIFHEASCG